jgi:dolichyl-diphosphooligosaccharide--protein glycosyltransferase
MQIVAFAEFLKGLMSKDQFKYVFRVALSTIFLAGMGTLVALVSAGYIAPFNGRFYSLWDTGYAKIHIPIIASVSEHQPTAWPSFMFDLGFLIVVFPAGIYLCFQNFKDEHLFIILYAVFGSYFAGVMVRLMLTLTPIVCIASAIAISTLFDTYLKSDESQSDESETSSDQTTEAKDEADSSLQGPSNNDVKKKPKKKSEAQKAKSAATATKSKWYPVSKDLSLAVILPIGYLLVQFVAHSTWVTSNAYSSPSIVLAGQNRDGSTNIIDDFREAYYWLRQNTDEKAKILSWWDYGYQITGMSNRTVLVDNNTWNNTHIATVGKAMSCSEEVSYEVMRKHDVDYVLVIFGALLGYSGDDINKFLWMIRIGEGIYPKDISERKFFTDRGEYAVGKGATDTMKNSLLYKLSYYRFNELGQGQPMRDNVRQEEIPATPIKLSVVDEGMSIIILTFSFYL